MQCVRVCVGVFLCLQDQHHQERHHGDQGNERPDPERGAERVTDSYSRYPVSVASESELSEVVSEVVSELRRVESELSRSRSKVIEGIE